jgi:hypothetical protein
VGCLDLDCQDSVSLGDLKEMLCTPVQLSLRPAVTSTFDRAWQQLVENDNDVLQYLAQKREQKSKALLRAGGKLDTDPNDIKIPFSMLTKLCHNTVFKQLIETKEFYGIKGIVVCCNLCFCTVVVDDESHSINDVDQRSWSYMFEEEFYHPVLLRRIKTLRREIRNEDEVDLFLAERERRSKRVILVVWGKYIDRRVRVRNSLIGAEIRTTMANLGMCFDKWKKLTIAVIAGERLQRCSRGFIVRRRAKFMQRLQKKVTMIQAHTRQYMVRSATMRMATRLRWAAVMIQRAFRGRRARQRVTTMVESLHDKEKRRLLKERLNWLKTRELRAVIRIQIIIRRFIRRRRALKRIDMQEKVEYINELMVKHQQKMDLLINVFKQQLTTWYRRRKEEYDDHVINERTTGEQRKKIIEKRNRAATLEKQRKRDERERLLQKVEEERIEFWIKQWEIKIDLRAENTRKTCEQCLISQETPEEIALRKYLQKEIKVQIKEVLRMADKQKIPMEIPEAYKVATKDVIVREGERERERAKLEMKAEANRLEAEDKQKKELQMEKEKQEKKRKKNWAILTLQKYMRCYLATRVVRDRALKRYEKSFDAFYHEYYYQDKKLHTTTWKKPSTLGSYDVLMDDHWIVLHCNNNYYYQGANPSQTVSVGAQRRLGGNDDDNHSQLTIADDYLKLIYFYNPSTWEQSWAQPRGTILCDVCNEDFAKIYFQPKMYNDAAYSSQQENAYPHHYFCNNCFYFHAEEMLQSNPQWTSKDVLFQPFNGGKPTADYLDFSFVPFTNWLSYGLDLNPQNKLSEEEEESLKLKEEAKQAKEMAPFCQNCMFNPKTLFCLECELYYCKACCKSCHRGKLRYHTFTDLDGEEVEVRLPSDSGPGGNEEPKKKKKKKKVVKDRDDSGTETTNKKRKSKTAKPKETSGTDTDTVRSTETKKNKKKKLINEGLSSDTEHTLESAKKKKTKKKKSAPDGQLDESISLPRLPLLIGNDQAASTPKKSKRSKTKSSDAYSLSSENNPLVLPPINQKSTGEQVSQLSDTRDALNSDAPKKKKKRKKVIAGGDDGMVSSSNDSRSEFYDTASDSDTSPSPTKREKSKKPQTAPATLSSPLFTLEEEVKPKKKKKKTSAVDSAVSDGTNSTTPKKKKKSVKPKKFMDDDGSLTVNSATLSVGDETGIESDVSTIGKKKKKKKKKKADTETEEGVSEGDQSKAKKKKKKLKTKSGLADGELSDGSEIKKKTKKVKSNGDIESLANEFAAAHF